MAKKYKSTTIKSRSNAKLYLFVAMLLFVVVILGGAVAVYATNHELNNIGDDSGVGVMASVSGNDLIIKIMNEGRAAELDAIKISVSDLSLSDNYAYKSVSKGASEVVYKEIAYGVSGQKTVVVKGYFNDGTTSVLLASNVYFG